MLITPPLNGEHGTHLTSPHLTSPHLTMAQVTTLRRSFPTPLRSNCIGQLILNTTLKFSSATVGAKPNADLAIETMGMAYEQRGRLQNVLCRSAQGSQYVSWDFRPGLL
jgi:transposase InsO family protein